MVVDPITVPPPGPWPSYVKPPAPPRAWAIMHHADIGLPPDPPLGVKPDDGSWIVPLIAGVALGCIALLVVT